MQIFKYHPDNIIYWDGKVLSYEQFMGEHPNFPITEGSFFEYGSRGDDVYFETINSENHHIPQNLAAYNIIIAAINNL